MKNKSWLLKGSFLMYLIVAIAFVTWPYKLRGQFVWEKMNLVPVEKLLDLIKYGSLEEALRNIAGNLLLLFPFGLFLPFFMKKARFLKVLFLAIAFSVCIEVMQLGILHRSTDIDDVLLNGIGASFGYLCFRLLHLERGKKTDR